MFGISRSGIVIAGLLIAGCPVVLAQPAGAFIVVQNEMTGGTGGGVDAGQALVLGAAYRSAGGSAAKLMLDGNTLISIGPDTEFRVGGRARTEVELTSGSLRAYASHLDQAPQQVEIRTPTLVAEVLDSETLVQVLDDGTCTVTVFSGSAVVSVQARAESQVDRVELTGGQQARVGPSGHIEDPARVGRDELDALWASVEAVPTAPRALPARLLRQWEVPTRSGGERLATDCISCPDRRIFDGRGVDTGPGAAAVTSGSKSGKTKDR